jgi:hypothetical protein
MNQEAIEYNQGITDRVEDALAYFCLAEYGGEEDPSIILTDMLTNLRHYSRKHNLDWYEIDERAREHFNAEVNMESEEVGEEIKTQTDDRS